MSAALHPIFAQALAPIAPPSSAVHRAAALQHYKAALADFDFQAEFSDDYSKAQRARTVLPTLRALQAEVDPDGAIWLAAMPKELDGRPLHGAPLPITQDVRKALDVIASADLAERMEGGAA